MAWSMFKFHHNEINIEEREKDVKSGGYVSMPRVTDLWLHLRPRSGDRKGNIPEGTRFEDLSEEWRCPSCGASKRMFKPMIVAGSSAEEGGEDAEE